MSDTVAPDDDQPRKKLTRAQLLAMEKALQEVENRKRFDKLYFYKPFEKQLEFHQLSGLHGVTCFSAGNQLGKTYAGAAQAAYFLTGRYPEWWKGRKWDRPTTGVVMGVTAQQVRESSQRLLVGEMDIGTGLIPEDCLERSEMKTARGVADVFDTIKVRHASGEWSRVRFMSSDQGREKVQGQTVDWFWCDEEPAEDVYKELKARLFATGGIGWLTFTPLKGVTGIVQEFFDEPGRPRLVQMAITDSPLYTPERIEELKKQYPRHEWQARFYGEPQQGEGAVFTYPIEDIACDSREPQKQWAYMWGLDFGMSHPFAAVLLGWDKDMDVVYVMHTIKMKDALPSQHCEAMKSVFHGFGNFIPAAWPQDGTQRREFDGQLVPLRKIYQKYGQKMLEGHAKFSDGSISTETGILEMSTRFASGRLKVFRNCQEWFQEYGRYHRKDGMLVKVNDDLMSATRVGVMALRFARQTLGDEEIRQKSAPRLAKDVDFDLFG